MSDKLKYLIEESKEDIQINFLELINELNRIPTQVGKWLTYHQVQRQKMILIETDYKKMVALKTKFYMGKMDDDEREKYGWPLEGTKVLKADLHMWLDSDDELIKEKHKYKMQEQIVSFIETTINIIQDKKWSIKNYIEWKKWTEGG